MIVWINGAFGSGKTQTAFELKRHLQDAFVYDSGHIGYFARGNIQIRIILCGVILISQDALVRRE